MAKNKSERRKVQRRRGERRRDAFTPDAARIRADDLDSALSRKAARVELRLSAEEKEAMEALAARYGLTLSEYIRRLHAVAQERLGDNA